MVAAQALLHSPGMADRINNVSIPGVCRIHPPKRAAIRIVIRRFTQRPVGIAARLPALTIPLVLFHIDTAILPESDTFFKQQLFLIPKTGSQAAGMIYHPVAGIITVKLSHTQHFADKA